MRIGIFTDGYAPQLDGVGQNLPVLVKKLREAGHDVFVVAAKHPGYDDKDQKIIRLRSVRVHKNPEWRMAIPIPEKEIRDVTKIPFDIIHGHMGGPISFLGFEVARRKNIPYIFTYHTLWNRYTHYILKGTVVTPKMTEVATRVYCNFCTMIIAPTSRVKEELRKYKVTKPIVIIPGGLEMERFQHLQKGFLREKLPLSKNAKIVLYVGRLGREKNVDFIINSFKLVRAQEPDSTLVLVGDGNERKHLESLVKDLGLSSKVFFAGFMSKSDIPKVYADSDVFAFASRTETQGLVVPEALSAGLPCVVVDDPAFEGVVLDDFNGLVSKSETKDFSSNLLKVLQDKKLHTKLSQNSRLFAAEHFPVEKQVQDHIKIYKKALILHKNKKTSFEKIENRFSQVKNFLKVNERIARFKELLMMEIY